jgi:hypothetical protein
LAVGNSLTAGYADNTLYKSGQMSSYPSILATQFTQVGGGTFNQPLLPTETGWPSPKLVLATVTDCNGNSVLSPVNYAGFDTAGSAASVAFKGPFNNVGVPGIKCIDYVTAGFANQNPYAGRFYANNLESPLDEALRIGHTFFTCWLGSNDVLLYATSGGVGNVPGHNYSDISDTTTFRIVYNRVVDSLTRRGAKGMLINIPDVTSIPYFTAIPANGLVLDATKATALNTQWGGNHNMSFVAGNNNFVIADVHSPNGVRQIYSDEYVILTASDSIKCKGWGSTTPLPAKYVLTRDEVANVRNYTAYFNQIILNTAALYNLGYVDMNVFLKTVQTGIAYNGVNFSAQYVAGGAFSLDGVHLTPKGYALVANEIIRWINSTYNSTVPYADVNSYNGIKFP